MSFEPFLICCCIGVERAFPPEADWLSTLVCEEGSKAVVVKGYWQATANTAGAVWVDFGLPPARSRDLTVMADGQIAFVDGVYKGIKAKQPREKITLSVHAAARDVLY